MKPIVDQLRLRHLRLLPAIEGSGSMSGAARMLGVAQPAVSKMLADFERSTGLRLVERGARGARLTEAGRAAAERVKVAFGSLDLAFSPSAGRDDRVEPVLRVGALPVTASDLLPRALARLSAEGFCFRVDIVERTVPALLDLLAAGAIDVFIGPAGGSALRHLASRGYAIRPLREEGIGFAARPGHALARRKRVLLSDLAARDWILAPRGSLTRQSVEEHFLAAGLKAPAPRIESLSIHTNLRIVAQSDMIAAAPLSAIRDYAAIGMVAALALERKLAIGPILFVAPAEAMTMPATLRFARALGASGGGGSVSRPRRRPS